MIDTENMPHLADIPRHQASVRGNDVAIWFEGQETNFRELEVRSNRVAHALLAEGIEPGDRIAFLGKNNDRYFEILFGCTKVRAAMAGMNNRLAAPELQFVLSDSEAKILFVTQDFMDIASEVVGECPNIEKVIAIGGGHNDWEPYAKWRDVQSADNPGIKTEPDDDVIQLYTSGTTGLPKGVQLTNSNYTSFMQQAGTLDWAGYDEGDVVMLAMPLFHVAGVNIGVLSLHQGCKTVVLKEVNPIVILDLIEQHKIAQAFWVPAVILMLTQTPGVRERNFASMKNITYGASPITQDLLLEAKEVFGCKFTQVYGLTETTGGGTFLPPEAHDPAWGKLRSCGVPYPGTIIKCVDENGNEVPQGDVGEIVIQSGFNMKGYWKRDDATAEAIKNGFFYTGDAGYFDEDGFLFIHDRVKDMIVSGGENVYPAEVENAIFGHPAVADVAVIGVPSEKWGEEVKALIVPKEGENPSEEDIIAWAKERIAGYKCPKSVEQIEVMPRNPSGKILRKDLREPYWKGVERRVG